MHSSISVLHLRSEEVKHPLLLTGCLAVSAAGVAAQLAHLVSVRVRAGLGLGLGLGLGPRLGPRLGLGLGLGLEWHRSLHTLRRFLPSTYRSVSGLPHLGT